MKKLIKLAILGICSAIFEASAMLPTEECGSPAPVASSVTTAKTQFFNAAQAVAQTPTPKNQILFMMNAVRLRDHEIGNPKPDTWYEEILDKTSIKEALADADAYPTDPSRREHLSRLVTTELHRVSSIRKVF